MKANILPCPFCGADPQLSPFNYIDDERDAPPLCNIHCRSKERREVINILSLGAGVQSSTLALMAAAGEIGPMPVAAIFADTQGEPKAVYAWLDWLERQLPFPVVRATQGNLAADSTRLRTSKLSGNTYLRSSVPAYTLTDGKRGMLPRQCTRDYKIDVVRRATRKIMKEHAAKLCRMWIGISTDEASRMKPSPLPAFVNAWPLIDAGISRQDCLAWMAAKGHPKPPRSACSYCPYHSDREWTRLRDEEPEAFADAVAYERVLSKSVQESTALKASAAYLHSSRVPLSEVVFSEGQLELFDEECEGMCGV